MVDDRFQPLYQAANENVLFKLKEKLGPGDRLDLFVEIQLKRIKEYQSLELGGYLPSERKRIVEGCLSRLVNVLGTYRIKEAEMLYSIATAILEGKDLPKEEPKLLPGSPQPGPRQSGEQPAEAQEYSPEGL